MRTFGPTLLAFLCAIAIVATAAHLSSSPGKRADAAKPLDAAAEAACTGGAMIGHLADVREASGLTLSRKTEGLLWTMNDSGAPMIFGVGVDGKLRAKVRVTGAEVSDWEAITTVACPGGSCLALGDIGDNGGNRREITVYRFPEPDTNATETAPVETFRAAYPDGPQDAETLVSAADGRLLIVTKGENGPIQIYRFPATLQSGATMRLERMAALTRDETKRTHRVTDGATSPDGRWIALRGLQTLAFFRASDFVGGAPRATIDVDVKDLKEPQGEGLALGAGGAVYLAGEGGGARGGTLARLSCKLP